MNTIIFGDKTNTRGVVFKIEYDETFDIDSFAKEALRIGCESGIGDKLFDFEEKNNNALGGKVAIIESSASTSEYFDVSLNEDHTQGVVVDVFKKDGCTFEAEELRDVAKNVAKIAVHKKFDVTAEFVADTDLMEELYSDSGKSIKEFAEEKNITIDASISRIDGSSIA